MAEKSIVDLLARIATARLRLGPNNPYRALLHECGCAILAIAKQYQELKERPTIAITRVPEPEDVTEVPVS